MKTIYVLYRDKLNGQHFIVNRREDETIKNPSCYFVVREFNSLNHALFELSYLKFRYESQASSSVIERAF